jgi:hypothetical protein
MILNQKKKLKDETFLAFYILEIFFLLQHYLMRVGEFNQFVKKRK